MSTIPNQTTLYWQLDDNNYRVAVQTSKGLLQVKSVTNNTLEMDPIYRTFEWNAGKYVKVEKAAPSWWAPREAKKTMFADFMTWYSCLPTGGKITIKPYTYTPSVNKKTEKPLEGTDAQKFGRLCSRFHISEPKYRYRQEALLVIGDLVKKIYTEIHWNEDHDLATSPVYIRVEGCRKRYNTFAEIGDCLNAKGQPKITVNYRKKTFSVADLF
jgi:hypothetical protein